MDKRNNKRELILNAALALFAEKGYDGVGIDEIGDAVNMKGPALYYYFKGKEAILNELCRILEEYYSVHFGTAQQVGPIPGSLDEFKQQTLDRLHFTLHDQRIVKVRHLLCLEQFRNQRLSELATAHQFTGVHALYAVLFGSMIQKGLLRDMDPSVLAFEFTTPISLMIQIIDRDPKEENRILPLISAHIDHFISTYGVHT